MNSANGKETGPTERREREARARKQVAELAKSKVDSQRARKAIDEALHPDRGGRSGQLSKSSPRPR